MKNKLMIALFCCVALAQLSTSFSMIINRESVLKNGEQFKFKAAPFDPYDAFRGRYVALQIAENTVSLPKGMALRSGQEVYARIAVDEQGFAKFTTLSLRKPQGIACMQAKVSYISKGVAHLDLPVDRYYMEEKAAPAAEKAYREHTRRGKQDAYILVRVRDGFAVIEALYVGDRRIEDVVKGSKNN